MNVKICIVVVLILFCFSIKSGLLATLANEADLSVKSAIAQLIGQLAKYELADDLWPELLQFIFTLCSSDNIAEREVKIFLFSSPRFLGNSQKLIE